MTFRGILITVITFILFGLSIFACSDTETGYSGSNQYYESPTDGIDFLDAIENQPKKPLVGYVHEPPLLELLYMQDCYEEQWYFCPPLDAVWQFKIVMDVCKDPPEPIEVGECVEKFECDPSNSTVDIIQCNVADKLGTQEKWCDKGIWKYTDCSICEPEVCNNLDDDCDGLVDEDLAVTPCENECGIGDLICVDGVEICFGPEPEEEICDYKDNDCDGEVDENQLNDCGACGPLPEDFCNGFDDDCDGLVDEDLIQECSTICGNGLEFCYEGQWIGCTAQPELPEVCNGFDDDCDGLIDEDLNCLCTIDLIGALFPCFEPPLVCGGGYKTCECIDEDCIELQLTPCYAQCYWQKPVPENCDQFLGFVDKEMCNNHDDNCNQLIDEDLFKGCYTGPPETLYVGICEPGQVTCEKGSWGNYYKPELANKVFINDLCLDEVLPEDKDACNGVDDNCDGIIDDGKEMEDTDILFIVDWSGSMIDEIQAVMTALNMFAANYSDEEVIKWGLIIGPVPFSGAPAWGGTEFLQITTNLADFQQFISALAGLNSNVYGGTEMLYDAIYLAIHNLVAPGNLPWPINQLQWYPTVNSIPELNKFNINWRDDTHHVIILFTDEEGQSYLEKDINNSPILGLTQDEIIYTIQNSIDLSIYTFTPDTLKNIQSWNGKKTGWEPLTQFQGKWYKLTSNAAIMYENLLDILDETACGE